ASVVVWFSFNKLAHYGIFKRVDDALGVVHTHGVAGLTGGILTGVFADPRVVEYIGQHAAPNSAVTGLLYGHPGQVTLQLLSGLTVIAISGVGTFVLLKLIGLFVPLRYPDEVLAIGDRAIHAEVVTPDDFVTRVDSQWGSGAESPSRPDRGGKAKLPMP
ncbi:ammonium transporter, partial [mine drainage metagenome]